MFAACLEIDTVITGRRDANKFQFGQSSQYALGKFDLICNTDVCVRKGLDDRIWILCRGRKIDPFRDPFGDGQGGWNGVAIKKYDLHGYTSPKCGLISIAVISEIEH